MFAASTIDIRGRERGLASELAGAASGPGRRIVARSEGDPEEKTPFPDQPAHNGQRAGEAWARRDVARRRHHGCVTPEQAKIAEDAGASAVMALERVPSDIRRDGGVARMSDPSMIKGI